jgi:hypothetical protein
MFFKNKLPVSNKQRLKEVCFARRNKEPNSKEIDEFNDINCLRISLRVSAYLLMDPAVPSCGGIGIMSCKKRFSLCIRAGE